MNTKTKILSELILDTDRSFKWFHSNAFTSHTLRSPLSDKVCESKEGTSFTGTIGKSRYSGYVHEKGIVQLFLVEDVDGIKEDLLDQRLNVSYALLFLKVTSVSTTPVIKLIPDHHLPQGLIPENYTPGEGYSL